MEGEGEGGVPPLLFKVCVIDAVLFTAYLSLQ